ncbi:glycosyltransferase family 8 protein [Candidatus Neomarinimicrobiota bacterium]
MQKLNIVFTIDENFIPYFTVACTSLLENNKNIINRIFVINDITDKEKLNKSVKFFKNKYNISIEELNLDSTILDKFKISHHITKATYFRLLLAEILPKEIDTILYLDSDIIVIDDLSELIELNFRKDANSNINYSIKDVENISIDGHEYYIYAVDHKFGINDTKRLRDLDFKGNNYFNSGIMYINLKKWRETRITKTLMRNALKYSDVVLWWDQDILNITFDLNWGEIDFTYNAFGLTEIVDKNFKIIHFTSNSKPWQFKNNHPYKHLYWKYLKMTPFKRRLPEDWTIKRAIGKIIPKKIKDILIRSNI